MAARVADPCPAPASALLLLAAAELEERADYLAFRSRMPEPNHTSDGYRAVADWLRQLAVTAPLVRR
jgi:hypothetical protein